MRRTLSAALGLLLTGSFALAGTPLGGDDGGFIAPDKTTLKCEDGVGKAASKLAGAVFKCQIKQSDSSLKLGSSQDDDACETTATGKYTATVGKLTGCPSCLDTGMIATTTVSQIDSLANAALYCDNTGGTPFGGDDSGFIPPDKTSAKCEDTAVKAVSKLAGAIAKCHAKQADTSFKLGSPQDDDACESAASAKFTSATSKLTAPPCPSCLVGLLPTVGSQAESMIDSINGNTYCASPSGAFLR